MEKINMKMAAASLLGKDPEAKQESVQIKRSEYSLCPGLQLALNHGCSSLVWPGTRSNSTRMPFSCAALNSAAASSFVP